MRFDALQTCDADLARSGQRALEKREGPGLPLPRVRERIWLLGAARAAPRAIAEVSDGETAVIDPSPDPGTGGLIERTPAAWFAESLGDEA